jgi:hypothetical protein
MPTMRRPAAFCAVPIAALLLGTVARAGDEQSFNCTFSDGAAYSFDGKSFVRADVKPLELRISGVVPGAGTAELQTAAGKASLKVVQALGARHFLEVAVEGYLVITTIYEAADSAGRFAAAHSRHLAVVGEPSVAQYRGTCKVAG